MAIILKGQVATVKTLYVYKRTELCGPCWLTLIIAAWSNLDVDEGPPVDAAMQRDSAARPDRSGVKPQAASNKLLDTKIIVG